MIKRYGFWLCGLFLSVLLVSWIYISPLLPGAGFPLDDSWIYASFARSFAVSGEIAFNLGSPSVGFTSSLWFLLLSLGRFLGLSPVSWGIFLGLVSQVALAAGTGLLFFRFLSFRAPASSIGRRGFLSWIASLLVAFCGPLVWYSLSGMETTAFVSVGILAILFLSAGRYRWAGLFLGLLLITRIEGMALWGLAFVYSVLIEFRRRPNGGESFQPGPRQHVGVFGSNLDPTTRESGLKSPPTGCIKKILPLLIIPAIFLLLELVKNLWLSGDLLPTTFAGRKWLSVPAGGRGPIAYLRLWAYGLRISLLPAGLQKEPYLMLFWIGVAVLFLLSVVIAVRAAFANRRKISGVFLLFLWGAGHNLVYMIMLPSPSQAGRYQAINFLLFWVALCLPVANGLARGGGEERPGVRTFFGGVLSALLGAILLLDLGSTLKWKTVYFATVRHINDVHVRVARWVDENLPANTRLAAFDIGALKYYSPRTEVIDLGGLVDRDFAGYLTRGRVVDYMKDRKADYLAMVELQTSPGWIFENLGIRGDPRLELRPLFGLMQRPEIYRLHYQVAAVTFPKMVVYEIRWNDGVME